MGSGLPFPSPGDLPNSGIESRSPALQADALISENHVEAHIFMEAPSNLWKNETVHSRECLYDYICKMESESHSVMSDSL